MQMKVELKQREMQTPKQDGSGEVGVEVCVEVVLRKVIQEAVILETVLQAAVTHHRCSRSSFKLALSFHCIQTYQQHSNA